jgi:DNA-binding NarL/FixJ family response regulator
MNSIPAAVLVIESHPLMREALCTAIADEPDFKIAGQVLNGAEALDMLITTHPNNVLLAFKPDIILLAFGNPGLVELETLKALRKSLPDTPILALTSTEVDGQEQMVLDAGAHAALTKAAPRIELICALRKMRTLKLDSLKLDFEMKLDHYLSDLETS